MAKKLSDRIAAVAKTTPVNSKHRNRALFLAQRVEIQEAIADGWSLRLIWQTLHHERKIEMTYQAFCRNVANLLPKDGLSSSVGVPPGTPATESTDEPVHSVVKAPPAARGGFQFQTTPPKDLV